VEVLSRRQNSINTGYVKTPLVAPLIPVTPDTYETPLETVVAYSTKAFTMTEPSNKIVVNLTKPIPTLVQSTQEDTGMTAADSADLITGDTNSANADPAQLTGSKRPLHRLPVNPSCNITA